jgi:murein DD-endopeptidase MepM/ murein hydrolase activator NlpD
MPTAPCSSPMAATATASAASTARPGLHLRRRARRLRRRPGAAAAFHTPSALAFDRFGNLYVADTGNHAIRKIAPDGSVTTLAGDGQPGDADGIKRAARFHAPVGVAVDRAATCMSPTPITTASAASRPTAASRPSPAAPSRASRRPGARRLRHPERDRRRQGRRPVRGRHRQQRDPPHRRGRRGETVFAPRWRASASRSCGARPASRSRMTATCTSPARAGASCSWRRAANYHAIDDADRPPASNFGADGKVHLYAPHGVASNAAAAGRGRCAGAARAAPGAAEAGRGGASLAGRRQAGATAPMPWPVGPQDMPHEVVGLMGEVRGSYDGESRDHFHAGLDVRADIGTPVLAIAPGKSATRLRTGVSARSAKASPSGRCRTSTCASGATAATSRSMRASRC